MERKRGFVSNSSGSAELQKWCGQGVSQTATSAASAGPVWTSKMRRLTVAAPNMPASATHERKNVATGR